MFWTEGSTLNILPGIMYLLLTTDNGHLSGPSPSNITNNEKLI